MRSISPNRLISPRSPASIANYAAIVFGCILACSHSTLWAQENEAEYYLAALFNNHRQIRSGVFYIEGSQSLVADNDDQVEGPVKILCAFDFDKDTIRLDLSHPVQVKRGTTYEKTERKSKFARTKDYVIYWDNRNDIIFIRPKDTYYGTLSNFDIRLLGLINQATNRHFLKDRMFDWEEFASSFHLDSFDVTKDPDRVTLTKRSEPTKTSTEISLESADVPVPRSLFVKSRAKVMDHIEMEWQQIDGISLPKSYVCSERNSKTKYYFEWESVNQGIAKHYFDIEEFGLPPTTPIVDERTDPPRAMGVIGESYIPETVETPSSNHMYWWIAGVAFAGVGLGFYFWKRKS